MPTTWISAQPQPATYGEMMSSAVDLIDQARRTGCGPFDNRQQACDAIAGYQRFLGVVGRHLRLLSAPGLAGLTRPTLDIRPALPQLVQRLTELDITVTVREPWTMAADRLAVAHDLVATHVGPLGQARTPDADILTDPVLTRAATTRLLTHTLPPLAVSSVLLTHALATRNPPAAPQPPRKPPCYVSAPHSSSSSQPRSSENPRHRPPR